MRIAMYASVVILFITTVVMALLVYSYENTTLVSAASPAITVQIQSDDTHHNDPICENFNALVESSQDKAFDTKATFAIDQNKHRYEIVSYSSSSTYNPKDMTTKQKVEYLLRCNQSTTI